MRWALLAVGIFGVVLMWSDVGLSPRWTAGAALWLVWAVLEIAQGVTGRLDAGRGTNEGEGEAKG